MGADHRTLLLGTNKAIPDNRRQGRQLRRRLQGDEGFGIGIVAALFNGVVVNGDLLREGIVVRIIKGSARDEVAHYEHRCSLVVRNRVLEDLDVVVRVHHDPGTCRHRADDVALRGKIRRVVVGHGVVEHARLAPTLHGQIREIKDQNAAGVVHDVVLIDVGLRAVFDLDAGDIEGHLVSPHDDVPRLAHVDAGVAGANGNGILDQDAVALHGIETIGPVRTLRAAGPFRPDPSHHQIFALVHFDGVALGIEYSEAFEGHVLRCHQKPLGACQLPCEIENGLILSCAP